jgi:hypothetical protein
MFEKECTRALFKEHVIVSVHCYLLNQERKNCGVVLFNSDMETQVNKLCCIMDGLDRENVATIQSAVSQVNSFVEMFLRPGEFKRNQELPFVRLATHYLQTHNRPTCNETAAILLDA